MINDSLSTSPLLASLSLPHKVSPLPPPLLLLSTLKNHHYHLPPHQLHQEDLPWKFLPIPFCIAHSALAPSDAPSLTFPWQCAMPFDWQSLILSSWLKKKFTNSNLWWCHKLPYTTFMIGHHTLPPWHTICNLHQLSFHPWTNLIKTHSALLSLSTVLPNMTLHVLWTKSMPSRNQVQTSTSPTRTAPKLSYSQVAIQHPPEPMLKPGYQPATKENLWAHDPGKSPPCDLAHDSSCDLQALKQPHDLTAHDYRNLIHNLPRDWSSIQSPDHVHFLCTSHPLINTWKTVGMINGWLRINKVTRLTVELQCSLQLIYY